MDFLQEERRQEMQSVYGDVLRYKTKDEFPDALWRQASKILALKERVKQGELSD